ncbi:HipA N-terminal domain-containing protein [Rhizobium sp.]|jgi:serine/threonine-protein kinase HipA|uniref:HipA N-terminal domain-containing protein n=1 Tax=Rhizobium sp. TaxID=391 RepID=UPI002AA5FF93
MTTIFYESLPVAHLTFDCEWRLDYDPSWEARRSAFPVSLTMQLRSGPIAADRLLPWQSNLLPETHLAEIGQHLKVLPQDIVGLLGHIGRDTAGALSIGAPRKPGIHSRQSSTTSHPATDTPVEIEGIPTQALIS